MLTPEQVLEIRRRLELRELTSVIAQHFGVCRSTIRDIATKRSWSHI